MYQLLYLPLFIFEFRTLLELTRDLKKGCDQTLSQALKTEIEKIWLHSAKVARKAGHLQQGEWALLGAGKVILCCSFKNLPVI